MAATRTRVWSSSRTLRIVAVASTIFSLVLTLGFVGRTYPSAFSKPLSLFHGQPAIPVDLPKPIIGDKVAVIVETRMPDNLVPLILHFASVLGPEWPIVLYTMENSWRMPNSAPFQRALQDNSIQVMFLPPSTNLTQWESVSVFLTRPWFYEQFTAASRMLLFQLDSIICSNSNHTIDEFLEWDFVGAPVAPALGEGYNGGLSLRNPRLMLDIINNNNFDEDAKSDSFRMSIEDQWFYVKMTERPDVKLPPLDVAMKFSVETVWYDTPLGFHKAWWWQKGRMEYIQKYCPEISMAEGE